AAPRVDAQLRGGSNPGPGAELVLRLHGGLARQAEPALVPLRLAVAPAAPRQAGHGAPYPAADPRGVLAQRRITGLAAQDASVRALRARAEHYAEGDTDLAWTRLTLWRAQLVAALDLPPYEPVTSATVTGQADSPSTELLAGWLADNLRVPVDRVKAAEGEQGIVGVRLERDSGPIELYRPDGRIG